LIPKGELTSVESVEETAQEVEVKYYNLNGVEIQKPENGLYIKRTKLSDGKQTSEIIFQ
jgi:hypothetical protein